LGVAERQCTRCILTDAYPRISFDSDGVCSYCHIFDSRWKQYKQEDREPQFVRILEKARRRNPKYEALVGLSGGKDGCYTLHAMVRDYGARVLAYTYDNGFLSDGARRNIDLVVSRLGVDHRFVATEPDLYKRMYRALLKNNCSDFCMICSNGTLAATNHLALTERIPLVIWGLSPRTEPIMPIELLNAYDYRFMVDVMKPYVNKSELAGFKSTDLPWVLYTTFIRRVRHVFLPEYVQWDDNKNAQLLEKEYGWTDYGHGVPHFDCAVNAAVNYFMNRRLGISKVAEKLSQMVRCGQITRDEALRRLEKEDAVEEPVEAIEELCRRLDLTRDDIKPLLEGTAVDCRQFKGYARLFSKLRWLFWVSYKLGFTSESLCQKYR